MIAFFERLALSRPSALLVALAPLLVACTAYPQAPDYSDPQSFQNGMLLNAQRQDAEKQQNGRTEAYARERYRRMSDKDIAGELTGYCPNLSPPCRQAPPESLLQEAMARGLIVSTAVRPRVECSGVIDSGIMNAECN